MIWARRIWAYGKDLHFLSSPVDRGVYRAQLSEFGSAAAATREKRPVLILQQGKVGSTTIADFLAAKGFPVLHLHHVTGDSSVWIKNACRMGKVNGQWAARKLAYIRTAQNMIQASRKHGLKVIVPVRDPLARAVSLCFHSTMSKPDGKSDDEIAGLMTEAFHRRFHTWADATPWEATALKGTDYFDGSQPDWYRRELVAGLGVSSDCPAPGLDFADGFQIVRDGNVELLFIRTDRIDRCLPEALRQFLEIEPEADSEGQQRFIPRRRVRGGEAYRKFRDRLCIPGRDLDSLLTGRTALTFFDENERDALRAHWTRS